MINDDIKALLKDASIGDLWRARSEVETLIDKARKERIQRANDELSVLGCSVVELNDGTFSLITED